MKKVSGSQVVTTSEVSELPLPAEIQDALGELVGAAREGLLALSVGLGLRVVHQLIAVFLSQSHRSGSESVHIGGARAVGFGLV
jgi:hypothetical protein